MYDDKIKEEIIKIKDLNYFFNVINNLPKPQKKVVFWPRPSRRYFAKN